MRATLAIAFLTALTAQSDAATMTIYGDTADTQVSSAGIFNPDPGQSQGQNGFNGGFDYSMLFVFQLPVLTPGQSITGADFSFHAIATGSTFATDLYGVGYRMQPTVLVSDWYTGTGDPNNTLIQAGIVPPAAGSTGRLSTSDAGDGALLGYILAQYAAGATGGEYIFLRLSTNASNFVNLNTNFYYTADAAYFLASVHGQSTLGDWQDLYSPHLLLTLADTQAPEPGTLLAMGVGLAALRMYRRRSR